MTDYHPRKWSDWDLQPVPHHKSQKKTAVGVLSAPAEQWNQRQERHDRFIANTEDKKLKTARDKERHIVF